MKIKFWKRPAQGPSPEAIAARDEAEAVRERADRIYSERGFLMQRNHFAERIRLIYEGR